MGLRLISGWRECRLGDATTFDFNSLLEAINDVHKKLSARAYKAVNISLTVRNWIIGCYITEFEMNGSDRASYGERLLEELSVRLAERGLKRVGERELRRFRQFYLSYPQIREAVTPELQISGRILLENLSFTHLDELTKI